MRRVCVFSGTRADFGLLTPLMTELRAAADVELQVLVSGAHLSAFHGNTINEIEAAGFAPDETVDMLLASDSPRAIGQSLGLGVIGLTGALSRLNPDILVVLGDRYEALAAAQAAMVLRIPIAHIHGGETTEGAIDDAIRHAITKMAHLHFVAAEQFQQRVVQMGEEPGRVHVVGALGLDSIAGLDLAPRVELEEALGISTEGPLLLVTYHPVTLESDGAAGIAPLLEALGSLEDTRLVFTGSNADADAQLINQQVTEFCASSPHSRVMVTSLGIRRYLSLMALSQAVVGNSSSGLLEAPFMGVPTVNIGPRQQGRPRAASVLDCKPENEAIKAALEVARSDDMQAVAQRRETPYGSPGAGKRVAEVLRSVDLETLLEKHFFET